METVRTIIAVLLLAVCPLAAYFIYILYGSNDTLITFPIWMLYIGIAMLFETVQPETDKENHIKTVLSRISLVVVAVLVFFLARYIPIRFI